MSSVDVEELMTLTVGATVSVDFVEEIGWSVLVKTEVVLDMPGKERLSVELQPRPEVVVDTDRVDASASFFLVTFSFWWIVGCFRF